MPNMADITVKKADGTTDIVWSALSPSAGDKVAAIWRSQTVGAAVAYRPEFKLWTFSAPNGTQRVAKATLVYPVTETDSSSGLTKVVGFITQVVETKVLGLAADTVAAEAVYQAQNLMASALVKQSIKDGFAPT